jgi:PAS domain S-box-containing protein
MPLFVSESLSEMASRPSGDSVRSFKGQESSLWRREPEGAASTLLRAVVATQARFGAASGAEPLFQDLWNAAAELRREHDRYELILQGAIDGIWEWEAGKQELYCSWSIRRTLGYEAADLPAMYDAWADLLHPDDRKTVREEVEAHLAYKRPFAAEFRVRAKNGQYLWFRARGQAAWNEQGKAVRMAGSISEITALMCADQALREGEARMRAILDHAVEGILTVDEETRIESFNRAAERMFGYSESEVLGWELHRLMAPLPSDASDGRRTAQPAGLNFTAQGLEVTGRRKDGTSFPLEISTSATVLGERHLFTAILRDISERKRLERRTTTLHSITQILAQSKTVSEATSAITEAVGWSLGWDLAAIWLEASSEKVLRCAASWRSDGQRAGADLLAPGQASFSCGQSEADRVLSTGDIVWVDLPPDAAPRPGASGARLAGLTALLCPIYVNDVIRGVIEVATAGQVARDEELIKLMKAASSQIGQFLERTRAEDALRVAKEAAEQASRAKTDFLANVSHEIRTPLNAILGVADLLWESELDDEQRQYLSLFRRAGSNLLGLVNDLLDLSKVEAGQLELKNVAFDVREVVAQALESSAVSAYEKGLEMVGRVSPRVQGCMSGDPARLRQVLVNLLSNAVKFTARGEVVLDVDLDPQMSGADALVFTVRDTGIGIPDDKIDAIFDRFSQVDASSTRVHGGTGLGLAICCRLVELMGGRIWVRSELGVGTVFHFTAQFEPMVDDPTATGWIAPPAVARASERKRSKVLVVEDHAATRDYLVEILGDTGNSTAHASTGSAARAAIEEAERQQAPFDAILVDAKIKSSDGFDLLEWMRKSSARAKKSILLLPADAKANETGAVRDSGFACYILKPAAHNRVIASVALVSRNATRTPPSGPSPEPPASAVRSLDILLVEDHPDNRLIVLSYLKKLPHRVIVAENGEAAVNAFKSGSFHVVLMDMQMPVMDGYEATRTIRKFERDHGRKPTPIIALTAHALQEEVERTKLAGCDAHLGKPIVKATLLAALDEYASAATPADEDLLAKIDPDLLDLVPGYIQNRLRDVVACREHLEKGRFEEIRVLAHGMAGSGGAYGFDEITRIGRMLQTAARGLDGRTCSQSLDELDAYVRRIQAAYGQ